MAHLDQPFCRGDDVVCGGLRGHVPTTAHGPSVAVLLVGAVPKSDVVVAAISQPAGLGRFCGLDLRYRRLTLLVCGTCAGPGYSAGQVDEQGFQGHFWSAVTG